MKLKNIHEMIHQLQEIIQALEKHEKQFSHVLDTIHPKYLASAKNLIHYRKMRTFDLTRMQNRLKNLGMSRLARAEPHVLASVIRTEELLNMLIGEKVEGHTPELSIKKSMQRMRRNVKSLLGEYPVNRKTHIMVTMPTEAAYNPALARDMIEAGMSVARINCAHDTPDVWKLIAKNIREASAELEKPCKISMDLGGPKIRTGQIQHGPKVIKYRPYKSKRGDIIHGKQICIGPENPFNLPDHLPTYEPLRSRAGKVLFFIDARGKRRKLKVKKCSKGNCIIELTRTTYFETDMLIYVDKEMQEIAGQIGELPAIDGSVFLDKGDILLLKKDPVVAKHRSATMRKKKGAIPEISCTNPELFSMVKEGEKVIFDDGKIEGVISAAHKDHMAINITMTRLGGVRLRADKGINFPESKLTIRGLTSKDKADLPHVVKLADIVNMSFVNSVKDVKDIVKALRSQKGGDKLGLILKIETLSGFEKLPEIILAGMQTFPIGIMIARGDLALEIGWDHIAVVQKEIMQICYAAHIPDIWATQVFESLAKTGVPSRAEITDATIGQRAECVMLNKGPYILNAISLLDQILSILDAYQSKTTKFLPVYQK